MCSFGKTLFPGIRLGLLVVTPGLAELFGPVRADFDKDGDQLMQTTMGRFIFERSAMCGCCDRTTPCGARHWCTACAVRHGAPHLWPDR